MGKNILSGDEKLRRNKFLGTRHFFNGLYGIINLQQKIVHNSLSSITPVIKSKIIAIKLAINMFLKLL